MIRLRRPIQAALPCLCAFLLMGLYALELLPQLNLTAVNLTCILLACLSLFPGIVNAINTRKAECFSSSLLIAAAALAVNLRGQLPPSLSALSAWEALWAGLAAVSTVCLAAVLLRLMHWSQEEWEEIRRENQRLRRERIEHRRHSRHEQRQLENDQRQAWNDYRRRQTEREINTRNRRHQEALESREREARLRGQRRLSRRRVRLADAVGGNRRINAWAVGLTVAVIALYLLLPFIANNSSIRQWGNAIVTLGKGIAGTMTGLADSKGVQEAAERSDSVQGLAYYTLFYIALLGIVYVAFVLLYRAVSNIVDFIHNGNRHSPERDSFRFFEEYGTALSVFIVSMSALLCTTGRLKWEQTGKLFLEMLYAIFAVIILLVGIDVVRLTLRQCLEPGSFLRNNMELTFILVIENVMGTVLSVLMSLRLKSMLESILLLLFYNHKSYAHKKVEEVLERSMDQEIESVRDNSKKKKDRQSRTCSQSPPQGGRPVFRELRIRRWKK